MRALTIAVVSPGEMGQAVGALLLRAGHRVTTCLVGRSERTRALARAARFPEAATYADLVRDADVVLSLVPPAQALAVARDVAAALGATSARPVYIDGNAIAPSTVRAVAATVTAAGAGFVDVGIIGPAPHGAARRTRFYASGPDVERFATLARGALEVRPLGTEIGRASALKMCYGALTKGFAALAAELLVAARTLGLYDALVAEIADGQAEQYPVIEKQVTRMPPVAHRWVGEMEEVAKTFSELGLTPLLHEGAAELFRFVAATPVGAERPETADPERGLAETVTALAEALAARATSPR